MRFLNDIDVDIDDFIVDWTNDELEVRAAHTDAGDRRHLLPISAESDGTKKMIALFPYIRDTTHFGTSFIVDELDAEIHPLLLRSIVNTYHRQDQCSQLIFTAHDVTPLDRRYLRRDR